MTFGVGLEGVVIYRLHIMIRRYMSVSLGETISREGYKRQPEIVLRDKTRPEPLAISLPSFCGLRHSPVLIKVQSDERPS